MASQQNLYLNLPFYEYEMERNAQTSFWNINHAKPQRFVSTWGDSRFFAEFRVGNTNSESPDQSLSLNQREAPASRLNRFASKVMLIIFRYRTGRCTKTCCQPERQSTPNTTKSTLIAASKACHVEIAATSS
ncbi:hypothetical protein KIN20_020820 [Parelaphostrongylus tenuis]|uniref:Uncharacterized protein n=1 Tax=Parelaphostrongylus tenuis TaxID=148309 RepID=A0AAD5MN12_PARTN|nr:hypothetical protein KIN20_020820 [Parelaphostrongylus tenuis]